MTETERLAAARAEFAPTTTYLNTATLGLPPRRALVALRRAIDDWEAGTAYPPGYDVPLTSARTAYAGLVGVDPGLVAVGSQVSVFAGLVAASLPDDAEVLTAAGDFTSVLFPFHVQTHRGVTVREVSPDRIAAEVTERTTLVAVSAVQSATGRVTDLDALAAACAATGTRVLLDTTQAVGWLPIDASRWAYTVCGGYKWLLAPRGTAYLTVRPELLDDLVPHGAGWYAGQEPWTSIYGSPLRLAADARRFDVSPVWHAWIGAAPALELLAGIGTAALHRHATGLAQRFRAGVGLPTGDPAGHTAGDPAGHTAGDPAGHTAGDPAVSAIVSAVPDDEVAGLMAAAGIVGAIRAGRLRLSFHVSTGVADVDHAVATLRGHLTA